MWLLNSFILFLKSVVWDLSLSCHNFTECFSEITYEAWKICYNLNIVLWNFFQFELLWFYSIYVKFIDVVSSNMKSGRLRSLIERNFHSTQSNVYKACFICKAITVGNCWRWPKMLCPLQTIAVSNCRGSFYMVGDGYCEDLFKHFVIQSHYKKEGSKTCIDHQNFLKNYSCIECDTYSMCLQLCKICKVACINFANLSYASIHHKHIRAYYTQIIAQLHL